MHSLYWSYGWHRCHFLERPSLGTQHALVVRNDGHKGPWQQMMATGTSIVMEQSNENIAHSIREDSQDSRSHIHERKCEDMIGVDCQKLTSY